MSFAAFTDYWTWANQAKVTFDGDNKLILVNPGVTELNVEQDIYSDWKEWIELYDYMKYEAACRNVGGDPINDQGDKLGATFFLINGWKIRTWEGDHNLNVVGNFYSDDGLSPFLPTLSTWNILITSTVSNLIDKIGLNSLAGEVWDQVLSQHQIGGSTGKALKDALKIIKVLLANS
jgi:hypothetical protein